MNILKYSIVTLTIFLITVAVAQEKKLSADDLINLKQAGFSEETMQNLIIAQALNISVAEIIKLKKADFKEETILKLAIKNGTNKDIDKEIFKLTAEQWFEKVKTAVNDKLNIQQIHEYLENATKVAPNHYLANYNLGSIAFSQNKMEQAVDFFKKACASREHSNACFFLGLSYLFNGQYILAKTELKKQSSGWSEKLSEPLEKYEYRTDNSGEIFFEDKKGRVVKSVSYEPGSPRLTLENGEEIPIGSEFKAGKVTVTEYKNGKRRRAVSKIIQGGAIF